MKNTRKPAQVGQREQRDVHRDVAPAVVQERRQAGQQLVEPPRDALSETAWAMDCWSKCVV